MITFSLFLYFHLRYSVLVISSPFPLLYINPPNFSRIIFSTLVSKLQTKKSYESSSTDIFCSTLSECLDKLTSLFKISQLVQQALIFWGATGYHPEKKIS
jgi:hypothetical protein